MHHVVKPSSSLYLNSFFQLAVLQKNLSGIQEICNEYIEKYGPDIIFLRTFIWSHTQLGELKLAYEALQQMVVLAMRDSTSIFKIEEGKFSKKFDIPIPLKHEVGLKQFASSKSDNDASNEDQDIVLTINDRLPQHVLIRRVNGDTEHKTVLNVYNNELVMKVLRRSFNDVIHTCARLNDYGLAKQLLTQVLVSVAIRLCFVWFVQNEEEYNFILSFITSFYLFFLELPLSGSYFCQW